MTTRTKSIKAMRFDKTRSLLLAILAAGLLLRLAMACWSYSSTFDTATVGLMAINIAENKDTPLFFYGQSYFGDMEAYLAAFLFKLFGISELTLSMSPILFSLGWIIASYLLFSEWNGPRAGLVAATIIAIPSHIILRYCVGSDGGYPAAFMLGTLSLWLCLRISTRDTAGCRGVADALALGTCSGLGLWTHPITLAYLIPGAALLLYYALRHRFEKSVWVLFITAFLPFVSILAAIYFMSGTLVFNGTTNISVSAASIRTNLSGLLGRPLQQHLFNHWEDGWIWWIQQGLLLLTAGLYFRELTKKRSWKDRLYAAYPLFFAILFVALYVLHPMARAMAPRYTIPLWVVLLSGIIGEVMSAAPNRTQRFARMVLGFWIAFYGISNAFYIASNTGTRTALIERRNWIVDKAKELGLKSVIMVDSPIYAHAGQIFSFTARGEIAFVSPYDERHQPSADLAEKDQSAGLMVPVAHTALLSESLKEVGASWKNVSGPGYTLFHGINASAPSGLLVPGSSMRLDEAIHQHTDSVSDRNMGTVLRGAYDQGNPLIIQLDHPRVIDTVVLVGDRVMGRSLPGLFKLEGSLMGSHFEELRAPVPRISLVYTAGNQVWVKGYNARLECRFPAAEVDRIRLTPLAGQKRTERDWAISEIYIHEAATETSDIPSEEVLEIAGLLTEGEYNFVATDRWLTARLGEVWGDQSDHPKLYPRRNPKYKDTLIDRHISPGPRLAIVVATTLADETERIMRTISGGAMSYQRRNLVNYTIFHFPGNEQDDSQHHRLYWFDGYLMHPPSDSMIDLSDS